MITLVDGALPKYQTPPPKTKPKAFKYYNLGPKYLGKTIYHPQTIRYILPHFGLWFEDVGKWSKYFLPCESPSSLVFYLGTTICYSDILVKICLRLSHIR
jgi:hypothetical protein